MKKYFLGIFKSIFIVTSLIIFFGCKPIELPKNDMVIELPEIPLGKNEFETAFETVNKMKSGVNLGNGFDSNSFNENVINKTRYCFSYKDINFRLDIIENELALLEVEGEYENIEFPNFIDVLEDVTDNLEYRTSNLIKNNKILLNKR